MRTESRVTVVDATAPQHALESFTVCQSYLLCVASVPGATETDYKDEGDEEADVPVVTEETSSSDENDNPLGRVRFVQVDTVENEEPPAEFSKYYFFKF